MIRASVIAAALCLISASGVLAQDITIGFQTSLSGPIASIGLSLRKGVEVGQAYVSEVAGRKVKLIMLDDASDPSTAARNARKLITESKVDVIIGSAGAPLVLASAMVAFEEHVPMVSMSPVTPPADKRDWIAVVAQPADLMMRADVKEMSRLGIKTVGFIGFNDAWGDQVYSGLTKGADAAGIKVVANERYARADTSVTAQVLKLLAARPDAIVTGGSGTPGATPHLALMDRGYKGPIFRAVPESFDSC
jgi:branched-chain amino acid transport system substrate-binding protein